MTKKQIRKKIVDAAKESVTNPPYGNNLASNAFTLGLLTAAELIREDCEFMNDIPIR